MESEHQEKKGFSFKAALMSFYVPRFRISHRECNMIHLGAALGMSTFQTIESAANRMLPIEGQVSTWPKPFTVCVSFQTVMRSHFVMRYAEFSRRGGVVRGVLELSQAFDCFRIRSRSRKLVSQDTLGDCRDD
jgi:hypothetical protein